MPVARASLLPLGVRAVPAARAPGGALVAAGPAAGAVVLVQALRGQVAADFQVNRGEEDKGAESNSIPCRRRVSY